jgi:tetratricopeptide (TPR) repeat protein
VDLRAFTGGTIATAFTSGNGNFQFNNVGAGTYDLVVEQPGYIALRQSVDVEGPLYGLFIEIHSTPAARSVVGGSPTVSKRELSIPRKAHEDMEKGLVLLYRKSDYPGSLKQFQRAIQEYPDYYEAYTQIGVAYLHLKNSANAEQALRKSLDISQEQYPDAFFWLATLLSNDEHFDQAEPLARKGVELAPNSWQANSELARALLGLNRPAEAEKSAQAAVKLRPDNPLLYLSLANIHGELQDYPALLDDLSNYLKLAPTGPFADQARQQLKQVQLALGAVPEAPTQPAPAPPKP